MKYPHPDQIVWQFDTANFRIVFHVEDEDMNPADQFDNPKDVAYARKGGAHWFCGFVSVWFGEQPDNLTYLAHDTLGGCSYRSYREFVTGHRSANPDNRNTLAMKASNTVICHYFPDMVRSAISQARVAARHYKPLCSVKTAA